MVVLKDGSNHVVPIIPWLYCVKINGINATFKGRVGGANSIVYHSGLLSFLGFGSHCITEYRG